MLKPNNLTKTTSILAVVFFAVFMVTGPAAAYSFQTVFAHYGVQLDQCEDDDDYYDDNKKDCDRNFEKHDQEDDYCDDKEHNHNRHDNGDEWCDDHGEGKENGDDCDDNGKGKDRDDDDDRHDDDCDDNGRDHDNDNGHDDRHDEDGNNRATQSINQAQSSSQISQCVSGGSTAASCNNINLQNQDNSGNNAIAQD